MSDFLLEEQRQVIREALQAHPDVERVTNGGRSTEIDVWMTDGRFRVVTLHVREGI